MNRVLRVWQMRGHLGHITPLRLLPTAAGPRRIVRAWLSVRREALRASLDLCRAVLTLLGQRGLGYREHEPHFLTGTHP